MKTKRSENTVNVFDGGDDDTLLLELTETGNGFIARFPGHNSYTQDNYICMNYAEAHYLRTGLKKFKNGEK